MTEVFFCEATFPTRGRFMWTASSKYWGVLYWVRVAQSHVSCLVPSSPCHLSHTHTWINLTPLVLHEWKCIYLAICALSSTKSDWKGKSRWLWEKKSYACKKYPPRWNCHGSIVSQKQTRQAHFRSILQHQAKHKEAIPGNHQFHNTANCCISVSWLNVKRLHITFFLLP